METTAKIRLMDGFQRIDLAKEGAAIVLRWSINGHPELNWGLTPQATEMLLLYLDLKRRAERVVLAKKGKYVLEYSISKDEDFFEFAIYTKHGKLWRNAQIHEPNKKALHEFLRCEAPCSTRNALTPTFGL